MTEVGPKSLRPKRKDIPAKAKAAVLERQNHHCAGCKNIFTADDKIEFDHRPALVLRVINEFGNDYVPPMNDPAWIDALHNHCHLRRTVGRLPGAERTITTKGSDAHLAAKFRKLEGRNKPVRKSQIQSRGFPKGPKRKIPSRSFGA